MTSKKLEAIPPDAREYFSQTLDDVADGLRGRVDSRRFMTIKGNEACEYKITTPHHVAIGRMILAKPYLYSLEVASGLKDSDPGSAEKFFNSFKISHSTVPPPDAPANNLPSTQPW